MRTFNASQNQENLGESGGARKNLRQGIKFNSKNDIISIREGKKVVSFNSKLATMSIQSENTESFTPDNTNFKTHYRLNQGPMKSSYLNKIKVTGEEPSELADEAFGMGQFANSGSHPSLLGRTIDQFFGVRLRPKTPEGVSTPTKRRIQQESLSINPEMPKIEPGERRKVDSPYEVTLGHLLQTPSFLVKDETGTVRPLGTTTDSEGNTFENHPSHAINKGSLVERRLYHEAMGRLERHPDIQSSNGEINWTPAAHRAVQDEVAKFRKDVHGLYHGNGVTLENGTRVSPLYLSKNAASFITDVDEHFEPHEEDREKWEAAKTAFGNVTKGTGLRTITERAHSPWAQVYDTSFQRRVEDSDDETLKGVFKEHLGERGQHRYVAGAPVSNVAKETGIWKTALEDRLREKAKSPSVEESTTEETPKTLPSYRTKRSFSSKLKKFFFNSSNFK